LEKRFILISALKFSMKRRRENPVKIRNILQTVAVGLAGALCVTSQAQVARSAATGPAMAAAAETAPYQNPDLPLEKRVDDLVGRMTLEEKVSQLENSAAAIPRLGVPAYDWWNEGLHGVARSGAATVFPQAIGVAATWDKSLVHRIAETISTEARAKNADALAHDNHSIYYGLTFWSPNINIFRDPRWGRGQETYGEDPYLTSRLGVAFVKGMQGDDPKYLKVVSTPKHFAVHSGPESTRHTANVDVSPRDLEETYLPAFRATVTEGKADSVMCAYNSINGQPACANTMLLVDKLRRAWKFNGYVTSDCWAVTDIRDGHKFAPDMEHASVDALRAGTDTSCGPEFKTLVQAVKDGLVEQSEIDTAVKRLFTARFRLGLFDPPSRVAYARIPMSENDSAEHRRLALEAARKAMVLLKNDGTLPLKASVKTIAVVGPNAVALDSLEGNYNGIPSAPVYPLDGIEAQFKGKAKVVYAQGSSYAAGGDVAVPRTALHLSETGGAGLKAEYFDNADLSGQPAVTRTDAQVDFDWSGSSPVKGVGSTAFSVRWTGVLSAPGAGEYSFHLALPSCYPCNDVEDYRVMVDGKVATEGRAEDSKHSGEGRFAVKFAGNETHAFVMEYKHKAPLFGAALRLEWQPQAKPLLDEAVNAAKSADVVVALVGLSPDLEGEEMPVHVEGFSGGDRTDVNLPALQRDLLDALAATGKPLVVVMMNGSSLTAQEANERAAAILEAWYPGEEGGRAIAQTLAGENNPAGRLPVTFYKSVDELPPFAEYSMKGRTYRYFDGPVLYGFGYGLSYTKFAYSNLKVTPQSTKADGPVTVEADVANTGGVEGDEVAELYLKTPQAEGGPIRSLKGFERITLKAGQKGHLRFTLDARDLSSVSAEGKRAVVAGEYQVFVGGAQPGQTQGGVDGKFSVSGTAEMAE
jgi:beta-glucosidase